MAHTLKVRHLEEELRSKNSLAAPVGSDEVSKAAEAAREEAQKEADEAMGDLLVCLGQEEEKVSRLSQRLQLLGEDVGKLLEGIGAESDLN